MFISGSREEALPVSVWAAEDRVWLIIAEQMPNFDSN
jgi:hypothetical protein